MEGKYLIAFVGLIILVGCIGTEVIWQRQEIDHLKNTYYPTIRIPFTKDGKNYYGDVLAIKVEEVI